MDLFKLLGTIVIQNSEANQAIDETTDIAEKSEQKIGTVFEKIGKAFVSHDVTDEEMLAAVKEIYFSEEDAHE